MRNGPNDYSTAGIVTSHGNVIAWDYGMTKLLHAPVMSRLEPNGLPLFESVMPDPSIVVEMPNDITVNVLPPRVAPVAASDIVPDNVDGPVPVKLAIYKAALARKAAGAPLQSDEVCLSAAVSRGVLMEDGSISAASDVVIYTAPAPPLLPSATGTSVPPPSEHPMALRAISAPAQPVAKQNTSIERWGPKLALVGSKVEVEWESGWCEAEVVGEELTASGRQLFELHYTDPNEPEGTRIMYHNFDTGKQCKPWRAVSPRTAPPAEIPAASLPENRRLPQAPGSPVITRSRTTTGSGGHSEAVNMVGSLDQLTAFLENETQHLHSDDSELTVLSVRPVMLTDYETGRHVPDMLMAAIANSSPVVFSASDATLWDVPGNERDYNRSPHKEELYQLKLKKVELYKSLNTGTLVRRQPEWRGSGRHVDLRQEV